MDGRLLRDRREPVRLLHARDHHAPGRAARSRPRRGDGRTSAARAPVPLHRLATIVEAAPTSRHIGSPRRVTSTRRRAGRRSRAARTQRVGPDVAAAAGGSPTTPRRPTRSVARARRRRVWVVGETVPRPGPRAGKVQGRRTTVGPRPGRSTCPPGDWARTLRTTWVEPAYLETDASWCAPGRRAGRRRWPTAARSAARRASPVAAARRPRRRARPTRARAVVA